MAFHVACPITCERICYCELGGGRRANEIVSRVDQFVRDPWWVRPAAAADKDGGVVTVPVPKVVTECLVVEEDGGGVGAAGSAVGEEGAVAFGASAQAKRVALQRKAVEASLAAEDYVRKLEMGADAVDDLGEAPGGQLSSAVKVICRICFSGENEGSERARRMLSCKHCNKKYHRSCIKSWAEYRDLFHWSSWACPSCRICEICRRTGDPNKFMFCKRCDAAYHCYCQQPPHKNVSHGPYLCPKHTRCHSCGSNVHGSGHSTSFFHLHVATSGSCRWFLGYNFCDACGRLFMKEKYCPVCLKVYRDSESTPMVCCDICQRWVHCTCDCISEEKYLQFQADRNLHYKCAACRGDCYQITDVDDAVQELWRRRDKADRDVITKLRAAAGLPSQEEDFVGSPYSDDEEPRPVILKSDFGRSLKFSVKGLSDNVTRIATEQGTKAPKSPTNKKYMKKKVDEVDLSCKLAEPFENFERSVDTRLLSNNTVDGKPSDKQWDKTVDSGAKVKLSVDNTGRTNPHTNHGTMANNFSTATNIHKKEAPHCSHPQEGTTKHEGKDSKKGTKLVIHLGGRNRKLNSSPRSASSYQKNQEKASSNGSEESSQRKIESKRHVIDVPIGNTQRDDARGSDESIQDRIESKRHMTDAPMENPQRGTEIGNSVEVIVGQRNMDVRKATPDMHLKDRNHDTVEDVRPLSSNKTIVFRRRKTGGKQIGENSGAGEVPKRDDEVLQNKQSSDAVVASQNGINDEVGRLANSSSKDARPSLKLKLKNPYLQNNSLSIPKEEELNIVKRQRSKRKRPSPLMDKVDTGEGETDKHLVDETMDVNWILRKLGKNAIGKRVEVHQTSDNSWHKGVVSDVLEDSASLSVTLDGGRSKILELGKQGVRFIPKKQKRTKL